VFDTLRELRDERGKTLILVEQNAGKGLEFADVGYVLVGGRVVKAGYCKELLGDPEIGMLFLGG
jgi:branched-chain amino acid transport system ATP-binding protein